MEHTTQLCSPPLLCRRHPHAAQLARSPYAADNPHHPHNTHTGNHSNHNSNSSDQHQQWEDEDSIWSQLAFPTYLQSKSKHTPEVCRDFAQAVTAAERRQAREQALLLGGLEGGVGGDAAAGAGAVSGSMMSYSEDEDDEDLEPETAWHTIRCVCLGT